MYKSSLNTIAAPHRAPRGVACISLARGEINMNK